MKRVLWLWWLSSVVAVASPDADSDSDDLMGDTGFIALIDSDDDGIPDALDPSPFRCDGDFDGIRDPVEMGMTAPYPGLEGAKCFRADADPSTVTDPTNPDTDGSGLRDGLEDWNRNGRVDRWETDPLDGSDDLDSDGDGIPDVIEGDEDADGDGVPNYLDLDSDGDGRPDEVEWLWDRDGDGVPAFLDLDSDGDGLLDAVETAHDRDGDGWPAWNDPDADGDGIGDLEDGLRDIDGDGWPGYLDPDQDGDGIPDGEEWGLDVDCDGLMDAWDADHTDGFCAPPVPGSMDDAPFDRPFAPPRPVSASSVRDALSTGCTTTGGSWPMVWWCLLLPLGLRRR